MTAYLRPSSDDPAGVGTPPPVNVTVDGHSVTAYAGQTAAAVLLSNGYTSWRTTRLNHRPRSLFCAIGTCQDCLVTINDLPDTRACQHTVQDGDTLTFQQGAVLPTTSTDRPAPPASTARIVTGDERPASPDRRSSRVADVVVVGAGPAGMAAALSAADTGAGVLLLDSGRAVGGQYNRQLPAEFAARRPDKLQHGWKTFSNQRDRLIAHPRISHLPDTAVWAIGGLRLWVQRGPADSAGREVFPIDAKAVVLATGAYDRVLPIPGWDLPGVYTAGAAQALAKGQRIAVGKRVIVAGTGPFLLPVAESLTGVGADVVALLEANSLKTVRQGWSTDPLVAPSKLREALGYGAMLARHRIPLRHGWTVTAVHGTDRVEAVTITRLDSDWHPVRGTEQRIEVDAVCLGFGFTANLELATSAHCAVITGPDGGPAVAVDANQQTTIPGIFAAGELTGIGGADLSAAEGHVAGTTAAHHALSTTHLASSPTDATDASVDPTNRRPATQQAEPPATPELSAARAAVAKRRRFAAALAKAYPVRDGWKGWSRPDTVVCRCEEVTRGDLEAAADERGLTDGRALKLTSRAGLGLCQGRICSRNVSALLGAPDAPIKRPIAVPVRLRDLAEAQEE